MRHLRNFLFSPFALNNWRNWIRTSWKNYKTLYAFRVRFTAQMLFLQYLVGALVVYCFERSTALIFIVSLFFGLWQFQYDVYGNLLGLLAAHPVAPLVSLHHLDVVEPIFPNVTRVQALQRLTIPMKLDSAGLMQQSICYAKSMRWTVSVSWGFTVQIFRGVFSPREIEMPSRTFLNWYKKADYTAYAFNTRPVYRNPCQKPFVFYMSNARLNSSTDQTVSEYVRHRVPHPPCKWKMADPAKLNRVEVYKKPDPHLWDRVSSFFLSLFASFVLRLPPLSFWFAVLHYNYLYYLQVSLSLHFTCWSFKFTIQISMFNLCFNFTPISEDY